MITDLVQPGTQLILFKPTLEGRKKWIQSVLERGAASYAGGFWSGGGWLSVQVIHLMTIQEKGTNSPPHLNAASRLLDTGASQTEGELPVIWGTYSSHTTAMPKEFCVLQLNCGSKLAQSSDLCLFAAFHGHLTAILAFFLLVSGI